MQRSLSAIVELIIHVYNGLDRHPKMSMQKPFRVPERFYEPRSLSDAQLTVSKH